MPEFRKHSKPQRKDFPMLLKKEKPAQIDYLENWPEHYYEIENAKKRAADAAVMMICGDAEKAMNEFNRKV